MSTAPLSDSNTYGRVLRLAGPIILANLSVPLLGAVDTAIMGHMEAPHYLAGLALGALVFSFLYWGFGFLRMGTTGFAAQALGAKDPKALGNSLAQALVLALFFAFMAIIAQPLIAALAFGVLDGSPEALAHAEAYFAVRIWSAPATLMTYALLGWLIGIQRTRDTLVIQVVLNGLNAGLDYLFVVEFGWGVEGVALGTVIAEYVALAVGLLLVRRQWHAHHARTNRASIMAPGAISKLISVNGDIFIRTFCLITAFALVTREGGRLGDIWLDANAVLMMFQTFLAFGLDGFAMAVEGLAGAAFGAKDGPALRRAVKASTVLAVATAGLYTAGFALWGHALINMFTDLPEVRSIAYDYLPWLIASPILSVWCFQLDGIFIGAQRTRDMRNMMVIAVAAFLVVLYGGISLWGNHAIWAALMTFFIMRGLTLAIRYPALIRAVSKT
jgi:multidrug resistance protein, MATE family